MRQLLALPVVLVTLLAACGDSTGPDSSPVGTYRLESINASPLPYEIFGFQIVSGSLMLRKDNTYTAQSTVRHEDDNGQLVTESESEAGTYTRTGNTFRLTPNDPEEEPTDATFDGLTLTVNAGLFVAVYRKD